MHLLAGPLRHWPRRRWAVAGIATPIIGILLAAVGPSIGWWGWPSLVVTAGLAALVAASYVALPGSGQMLEVGCSPCAVVAGGSIVAAVLARANAADSVVLTALTLLLLVAALMQRLSDATACVASRRLPPAA